MSAPLAGLRVLELATGVAGPYAGRLLASLGATVVKLEPQGGDPTRTLPIDDGPAGSEPGPLFVHLNAGKRLVRASAVSLASAAAWADLVIVDGEPDAEVTTSRRPGGMGGPVVVATAPWGPGGEAGQPADELLVQAGAGVLRTTEVDAGEPLRLPGWQSQYLAGAYAAAAGLAALGSGAGRVDVSWLGAALTGIEGAAATYLHAASGPPRTAEGERRQAGLQAAAYPAGAFACADGFVIPGTVRPEDWALQCAVYGRPDLLDDPRFSWTGRSANREALLAEVMPWYANHTKAEIFEAALAQGWAAAMVMTASDALADRHLTERRFLSPLKGAATGQIPGRPWRTAGLAEGEPVHLARAGEDTAWFDPERPRPARAARVPAPGGLKIVELTWAWAGPFVGRFLGAFGADVVRVETGARPDGWRARMRWRDAGVTIPDGTDPEEVTWDAAPLFNTVNRNKRAVSVDLTTEQGRDVFLGLVRAADALVVNMTYRVLADRGVEQAVRAEIERGLVLLNMPAVGTTGPYRAMPGYGMLTEGLGGLVALFGRPDEGARTTTTYYPDAVAGVHGSVALLAALAGRSATGRGAEIDLSQQEALWMQLGEGLVLASRDGRDPRRTGLAEPAAAQSGVVAAGDGGVAFVSSSPVVDDAFRQWASGERAADVIDRLRAAGARAAPLDSFGSLLAGAGEGPVRLLEELDHPVTGRRTYVSLPVVVDGEPLRSGRPAPTFDQHTDEILTGWLGLAPEHLAQLRATGAVGTRPRQPRRREG